MENIIIIIIIGIGIFLIYKGYHLYNKIPDGAISPEIRAYTNFLEIALLFAFFFFVAFFAPDKENSSPHSELSADELYNIYLDISSFVDDYPEDDFSTVYTYFEEHDFEDHPSFDEAYSAADNVIFYSMDLYDKLYEISGTLEEYYEE